MFLRTVPLRQNPAFSLSATAPSRGAPFCPSLQPSRQHRAGLGVGVFLGAPGPGGAERPSPEQVEALNAGPYHGGSPVKGAETVMITKAMLVMADYLDRKGLAWVRRTYPSLGYLLQEYEAHVLDLWQGQCACLPCGGLTGANPR